MAAVYTDAQACALGLYDCSPAYPTGRPQTDFMTLDSTDVASGNGQPLPTPAPFDVQPRPTATATNMGPDFVGPVYTPQAGPQFVPGGSVNDPGNEAGLLQGSKLNNALNTPGTVFDTITGSPLGTTSSASIEQWIQQIGLVLLGIVIVGIGLWMFGKNHA
jgi:hypothetical protein